MGYIRIILGLGIIFILPWIWTMILGTAMYNQMTSGYSGYYSDPIGFAWGVWILYYGVNAIFIIMGLVITISGIKDWWRS